MYEYWVAANPGLDYSTAYNPLSTTLTEFRVVLTLSSSHLLTNSSLPSTLTFLSPLTRTLENPELLNFQFRISTKRTVIVRHFVSFFFKFEIFFGIH